MVAFIVPVVLATVVLGKARMFAVIIPVALVLLATSYVIETSFSSSTPEPYMCVCGSGQSLTVKKLYGRS